MLKRLFKRGERIEPVWRTPEELVEIGFNRSQVVMMNEAHSGRARCIRTREIGQRILPVAHQMGVRHLAVEALWSRSMTAEANQTRQLPAIPEAYADKTYLSQPEMRAFVQAALDLGWTLVSYEADIQKLLADTFSIDIALEGDEEVRKQLRDLEPFLMSPSFTNWREGQQAINLTRAMGKLAPGSKMLVWCGNSHLARQAVWRGISRVWVPMGYQFQQMSGLAPFSIDQTVTVDFPGSRNQRQPVVDEFAPQLEAMGGTAGFMKDEVQGWFRSPPGRDALILSVHNTME